MDQDSRSIYIDDIFRYICDAISIHIRAIPHSRIESIHLHFSNSYNGYAVEPVIRLRLDGVNYYIDISELWNSKLDLERERKNACMNAAELFWPEYRNQVSAEELFADMELVRKRLEQKYREIKITCEFV